MVAREDGGITLFIVLRTILRLQYFWISLKPSRLKFSKLIR